MKSLTCCLLSGVILLPLFGFTSCKEPATGPVTESRDSLVLKVNDAELTSATLSLHTVGIPFPAKLTLNRNGEPVKNFSLHRADTTLKDSLLTPKTSPHQVKTGKLNLLK